MSDFINNKILIIQGILAEKYACGLEPDIYNDLIELLDDIRIMSDGKDKALILAYSKIKELTIDKFLKLLIDKTSEEAMKLLSENNIDFRVVRRDSIDYMVTCDFRMNRINLEIDKNIITKCTTG